LKAGLRSIAATLTLALAAAGLIGCAPEPAGPSDSVKVREGSDVQLVRADGLEIAIPGDAITGSGTLSTETVEQDGLNGWAIAFDGDAALVGQAVITFPGDIEGDEPMPVLFYNEKVGDPLAYGGDPVKTEDGRYAVTTTHFSNWFQIDWGSLLTKGKDLVQRAFGQTPDAEVSCSGVTEATDAGYTATLTGSEKYTWCMGMEGTTPIVKIGNPNPYAIRVEATPGLVLTNPDKTLVSLIPQLFSVLADIPSKVGNTVFLLGAGDSYTFRWTQLSEQQGLQVMPSGAGYIASSLLFAVETVQIVWKDATVEKILSAISDTASCTTGFADMVQVDVHSAGDAVTYLGDALKTVLACMGKVVEKVYGADGIWGMALIAGVSWFFSGIHLAFTAVRAIVDAAPATLVLDGPQVPTPVPIVDAASFCRQVLDRQPIQQATETVGYSWSEVNWKDTKKLWGRATLADDWLECSINAGGMAPLYEVLVWIEFYSASGDAQEQFEKIKPSRNDEVTRIDLDIPDGAGFLNVYDGRPGYNSSATGYAYRGNVYVAYELRVGVPAGSREMGWPDLDTHARAATEAINQALDYAGE
jgi:hypothetical protein